MKRIFSVCILLIHTSSNFWTVGRKICFKIYLYFSRSLFPRFLSFTAVRRFFRIWQEGTCYLLTKDSVTFFPRSFGDSFNISRYADYRPRTPKSFSRARPGSLATTQHISSRRLLSKNSLLFAAERARSFWHQISPSFHGDLRPKNGKTFSQFPLTKKSYFRR